MQVYSVKEISDYIQNTLKKDPILSNVWIEGEVSNFNKNISGHVKRWKSIDFLYDF